LISGRACRLSRRRLENPVPRGVCCCCSPSSHHRHARVAAAPTTLSLSLSLSRPLRHWHGRPRPGIRLCLACLGLSCLSPRPGDCTDQETGRRTSEGSDSKEGHVPVATRPGHGCHGLRSGCFDLFLSPVIPPLPCFAHDPAGASHRPVSTSTRLDPITALSRAVCRQEPASCAVEPSARPVDLAQLLFRGTAQPPSNETDRHLCQHRAHHTFYFIDSIPSATSRTPHHIT